MHALYLRRRLKVLLPAGTGATPLNVIAAAQKNLESLGFLLAEDVVAGLKGMNPIQVDSFYQRLVKDLRAMVGAHRPFKPMYPNFPAEVMEMTEAELYCNALLHYWTLDLPENEAAARASLQDRPKLKRIRLGNREDFESIFTYLARSKSPFSPQDQEDVKWFVAQCRDDVKRLLPERIPCKENLGTLLGRFSRLPRLGACYLDDRLENYLVPFSQRSASKLLRTLVRGSRLPLPRSTARPWYSKTVSKKLASAPTR